MKRGKSEIIQLKCGDNFTYIIKCSLTGECILIDPAGRYEDILRNVGRNLSAILVTHVHPDHIAALEDVIRLTPVKIPVWAHERESKDLSLWVQNIHLLKGGESVVAGTIKLRVLHTPGHSPGSLCFYEKGALFTGDTLFTGGNIGRCDLPGGNAEEMYLTLKERLSPIPDSAVLYPGHDYGPTPTSTLGEERKTNRFMKCENLDAFLALL